MPITGASPRDPAFLSAVLPGQLHPRKSDDSVWHDESIGLAGSDDFLSCVDGGLVLFLCGRLLRNADLSARLGTDANSPLMDVLHAYRRWGDDFARYLLGDFALALWDMQRRRLLLARDVSGYRPLYYWVRGSQFRFASQARTLFAHGDITCSADERRIAHWLTATPEDSGATFFRDISSVRPGHTVVWERDRVAVRDFWQPSNIPTLRLADAREYAEGLQSVLDQAVRDRVQPFSTVGTHLSGGLDSSAVTATAASILGERSGRVCAFTAVPTVAIDDGSFPGRFCDESAHAAATAALYPNIEHVLIPTISGSFFDTMDRMSSASEYPQLNPGNSDWFHTICVEAASRGVRMVLTGTNGNFTVSHDGRRALSMLLSAGHILPSLNLARTIHRNGGTWRSIVSLSTRPLLSCRIRSALNWLRDAQIEYSTDVRPDFAMRFGLTPQSAIESAAGLDGRELRIRSIRRFDSGGYIAAYRKLTGVEQVAPTSDRRVMEFCLSVPEEHFCRDGRPRSLIKDAMSEKLPAKVLEERRRGRQSADVMYHLTRHKAEIAAELQRLKKVDLAVRCLNLPALESLVQAWPSPPYGRMEYTRYGTRLMRAISMGRFIRRLEEGTLFRDQLSAAA